MIFVSLAVIPKLSVELRQFVKVESKCLKNEREEELEAKCKTNYISVRNVIFK